MSKLLLSILILSIVLLSCSEGKTMAPVIELQSIFINQDSTVNYKDSLDKMPSLKAGDEIEVNLFLNGNGSALNTLNVSSSDKNAKAVLIPTVEGLVSGDKNFTDLENGRMSFVDGVMDFDVRSKFRIVSSENDKVRLSYHLSARAECEGGGVLELELKTKK